jgi:hypothetical protein
MKFIAFTSANRDLWVSKSSQFGFFLFVLKT